MTSLPDVRDLGDLGLEECFYSESVRYCGTWLRWERNAPCVAAARWFLFGGYNPEKRVSLDFRVFSAERDAVLV